MKAFKKVITWAMLSIMMQLAGLLFLDRIVFKHSSDFEVKTVNTAKKEAASINISSTAEKINSSYSGRYVTYYEGDKLMIVNTKTSEIKEVNVDEGAEIIYSAWLPRDNYIIIGEKVKSSSGKNIIKIITYNARTGLIKPVIEELCTYQKGMEIDDIVSSGTGTKYIGVSRGGYNSTIYRVDINDEKRELPVKVPNLGSIQVFNHKDELIYEDLLNKSFYKYSNRKSTKISNKSNINLSLLALDENDNIYMGEVDGEKISKVIYGKSDVDVSQWTTINLEKSKKPEDIHVNGKGEVMINDSLAGKVINKSTGDTITYQGMFLEMTNRVIVSSSNGTLYIKNLSDIDVKEEVKTKK